MNYTFFSKSLLKINNVHAEYEREKKPKSKYDLTFLLWI